MHQTLAAAEAAKFIAKELPFGQSRLSLLFRPLQMIEPGQIVGGPPIVGDGVGQMFGAFNPSATDGTENAIGVAVYRVVTTAGSTVRSPVIVRDAEVRSTGLIWPAGVTAAQQAEAIDRLRNAGIRIE